MLARENEMRLSPDTQVLYAQAELSADTDWMEVTEQLQERLVREFGYESPGDIRKALNALRGARGDYPDDLEIVQLANYMKFNRARRGDLECEMDAPNVPLVAMNSNLVHLHDFVQPGRPLVVVAGSYS
jgi:hypothetical protein